MVILSLLGLVSFTLLSHLEWHSTFAETKIMHSLVFIILVQTALDPSHLRGLTGKADIQSASPSQCRGWRHQRVAFRRTGCKPERIQS